MIKQKENLILILTQIAEILRDNAYSAQADAVRIPLQYLYTDDKENFYKYIGSNSIWGGAGAAWEVGQFPTQQIEKEFQLNFIYLFELIDENGIYIQGAERIANIFRKEMKCSRTDLIYQMAVDFETNKLLQLTPAQFKEYEDYGNLYSTINNKKISLGWWHYRFDKELHHIIFKASRTVFFILHKPFLNGAKLENGKIQLMTDSEVGDYD